MDELALAEREKYMRVWEFDDYRRDSPGMREMRRAYATCNMRPGRRLYDFGSGPARATEWFQRQGLYVVGIDIAPNAKETEVSVIEACLWDLPVNLEPADYGFCCDVMEHIPEEKVDDVLAGIARLTLWSAYFRIATRLDVFGPKLIGQPLHLTVRDATWWIDKVKDHFDKVSVVELKPRDIILLAE